MVRSLNISNLDNLFNKHRFAYFGILRKLITDGEFSIYEKHPKEDLAVKIQLFADGDLTVYISNPGGQFDDQVYDFLVRSYKKVHKKIKSLDALRRDIERIFSLLATGITSALYIHFGDANIEEIIGLLGSGFVFPEVKGLVIKAYRWVKEKLS
ncbi:MAG: hypothetical protein R8G66_01395 [Cytophagales bacterium]|nr:hypothetical protein [Cytophagales bacterium]